MPPKTKKLSDKVQPNLLAVKNALSVSIRLVAASTHKAYSAVGYYFRGVKTPPEDWIDIFCSVYCVDKDWLINGEGDPVFTGKPDIAVVAKFSQNAGARVKEVREKAGLSQKEFGERIGLTTQGIFNVKKDMTNLTSFTVARIEEQFDVGADWLMYGDIGKKNFPVSKKLIDWLWKNEDERKRLWERMTGREILNRLND